MIEICNTRDLRFAYKLLMNFSEHPQKLEEQIIPLKKAIRRYYRKQNALQDSKRLVFGDFDSYTELIHVPDDAVIYKEEWFDSEIRMEYIPSQYDCTGQRFTIGHKFVTFRGRLYCIHHVSIDV